MALKHLGILILINICLCSQDVPIKKTDYGFSVGDPYGTLRIQFFLDFQCPDSKASYNAWIQVRRSLNLQQNKVKLSFNFSPLPYHFYAVWIHQAFFFILSKLGATSAEDFMTFVFNRQDDFTQQRFLNSTAKEFVEQFSALIAKNFKIDPTELANELVIGSQSFKSLKDHWRYTTIVNGVSGTPMFKANGVFIDGAEQFGYLEWINFIKEYRS